VHKIPRLDRAARRRLINRGRKTKDPQTALRFLMIAKLGQGLSRQQVARDLACWPSTVVKAARRFAEAGEEGLLDQRAFNGVAKVDARFKVELERVLLSVPTEFGWQRTNSRTSPMAPFTAASVRRCARDMGRRVMSFRARQARVVMYCFRLHVVEAGRRLGSRSVPPFARATEWSTSHAPRSPWFP
jgi:hypothetical protein